MQDHIARVMGRYKGRIKGWDVVNEALDEDGTLRRTPWLDIAGEEFIAKAFEAAHAADPGAELYYNDYNLWKPAKRAAAIKLVQSLKARGIRVDGIGEQGHWHIDGPSAAEIDATFGDIAKAGLKVLVTELDIDVLPRDPDMWGADLSKKSEIKARTNLYPDGLPKDQQDRLARRYARDLPVGPEAPAGGRTRHVLGCHRCDVLAEQLPDPRARELPAAVRSARAAQAGVRRGGAGAAGTLETRPAALVVSADSGQDDRRWRSCLAKGSGPVLIFWGLSRQG